ncbi:adenosylcobinamide-phosphate synthase CbiB [Salidesulfovibrio onnuriiensis]|uniref:adenosylcobinamide-phosphate synthase CbiB n=1 Tax=Salidesulfovibrio onnuriiensis TaxID=2583823 RepID=UPI0011C869FC|nr:adenosylcobinamide-phosphate synthase CbiB [Salidesulfovibrio onnuriiensis]
MNDLIIFFIPLFAFLLDQLLADPRCLPHPVVLVGKCISMLESLARRHEKRCSLRTAGIMAPILLCVAVGGIVWPLASIPVFGVIIAIYLAFAGLALKGLVQEAGKVEALLAEGDIEEARKALAMLVSRETGTMGEREIRRSLAETVSENYSDGFFAPFFYLVLGGPTGLWIYKTINTFDSMWGYRNSTYERLGWFSAKTDDLANWIPARLSTLSLIFAGKGLGLATENVMDNTIRQAPSMESPNAGWPMAACAWLVGGTMGGPTIYFGKTKDKPILGPEGQEWTAERIETLFRLVDRAGWLTMLLSLCVLFPLSMI